MYKNCVNGLSPSLHKYSQPKKRRSIKENLFQRMDRRLSQIETSKVLQAKKVNDSFSTNKNTEENSSFNLKDQKTEPGTQDKFESIKNLEKIKNSIREIREESIKTHKELRNLKNKINKNPVQRNQLAKREQDLDWPRNNSKVPDLGLQIQELKGQLSQMNQKLLSEQEMIKVKAMENVGLQFTVFNLTRKLKKIRNRREEVNSNTCKLCQIF